MPYGLDDYGQPSGGNAGNTPAPQYGPGLAGTGSGSGFQYGSGSSGSQQQTNDDQQQKANALLQSIKDNPWAAASNISSVGTQAKNISNPAAYYGGYAGGANDAANNYAGLATTALGQKAATADLTRANAVGDTYGGQALGLDLAAAQGNAPSVAEQQFNQNLNASIKAQGAMANSARGGGAGLAAAQRQAATQGAQMQAEGTTSAAMLRANEMAQARAQLGQQSVAQQGLEAQTAEAQAQRDLQQNQINNQTAVQYYGLANQAEGQQLAADTSRYGANVTAQTAKDKLNSDNMWNTVSTIGQVGAGVAMMA